MFPWTKLPNELRHEVVKRMDFISRFRFRGVSKTDQQLVDTVPLYIPRVVLNSQNENKAHLTFFLGIKNRIDVFFVKEMDGMYKVTRSLNFGPESKPRRVKLVGRYLRHCESALVYATIVFRNVAMNPETILGGFEFIPRAFDCKNASAMLFFWGKLDHLPNRSFRAKTLMIENGIYMAIMACCSIPDLLELQVLVDCPDHPPLISYTKKQRYRIYDKEESDSFENEGTGLKLDSQYILTETEDVKKLAKKPGNWERFVAEWDAVKIGPNRYVTHERNLAMNNKQSHTSSCGIAIQKSSHKAEKEDPEACDLRWACAKHADPFEHWYYTHRIKSLITGQPPDALLSFTGKRTFFEYVFPIINGKSIVMDGLLKQSVDFLAERKMASLVTTGARTRKGINGGDGKLYGMEEESEEEEEEGSVTQNWLVSDGSGVSEEERSELESVGSESLEDLEKSEESEEEKEEEVSVTKDRLVSERSDMADGERSESVESVKPECLEDSLGELNARTADLEWSDKEESVDELESEESEGSEKAAGEVQKAMKVSEALESEDSDVEEEAENPVDSEEFKSKVNGSNSKIDKLSIIFAVLSAIFGFFLTFFFF